MKKTIYFVFAAAVLVGLFLILKPEPDAQNGNTLPGIKTFELEIADGKLVSGPDLLKVVEDDEVTIRVTADTAEEFHLHGYDLSMDLAKDETSELVFQAIKTGRFEYEMEVAGTELGILEVRPK